MFVASLFNFVSQVYIIPDAYQKECRETALKFMHGPRFWLHGTGGHAFFRAEEEIGFPAVPKCLESFGYQILYCAQIKHIPDFETKIVSLNNVLQNNDASVLCAARIAPERFAIRPRAFRTVSLIWYLPIIPYFRI